MKLVCADGVGSLGDYLEDALDPVQRGAIDAHLAGCARCLAFVKSYRATPRILREATLATMPDGLDRCLLGFLRDRIRPRS